MRRARTIHIVVSLLLLTPLPAWGQQVTSASGDVLTLEQAIALALHDNHLVKNAELDVGKVEDNLAAARTFRLPSVHLYTLLSEQLVKQETDEVKRAYYGILQTQSALDSLQESIRLYRELDRVTGDYVAQQVALKSDSLEEESPE